MIQNAALNLDLANLLVATGLSRLRLHGSAVNTSYCACVQLSAHRDANPDWCVEVSYIHRKMSLRMVES